jgi:hypothetical protein
MVVKRTENSHFCTLTFQSNTPRYCPIRREEGPVRRRGMSGGAATRPIFLDIELINGSRFDKNFLFQSELKYLRTDHADGRFLKRFGEAI